MKSLLIKKQLRKITLIYKQLHFQVFHSFNDYKSEIVSDRRTNFIDEVMMKVS